jgi:hypothetical protein
MLLCLFYYGTLCRFQETANFFGLIPGVASGRDIKEIFVIKRAKLILALFIYGLLCCIQETAIFTAVS